MIIQLDGIHIRTASGRVIVADSRSATGDVNVVSHAHTDHLPNVHDQPVICSTLTAELSKTRTSGAGVSRVEPVTGIELIPSGHVLGSRAALIDDGERILYTGDLSTRDRCYLRGFEPVEADVLIIETTYGIPRYRFPPQPRLEREIDEWLEAHGDVPVFLFGYPLGRSQKLHYLAGESRAVDRLFVHESIRALNEVIERHTDLRFPARPFEPSTEFGGGDAIILPSNLSKSDPINRLVATVGGVTAGFSGWAVNDGFRYRGGYDAAFPLSDHCDFDELVAVVEAVDPDLVLTHHGFDEAFADYLASEHGYDARPLKKNQTSLTDF